MPIDVTLNDAMREGLSAVVAASQEAEARLKDVRSRVERVLGSILQHHGVGQDFARIEIMDLLKGTIRLHEPEVAPVKPGTVLDGGPIPGNPVGVTEA